MQSPALISPRRAIYSALIILAAATLLGLPFPSITTAYAENPQRPGFELPDLDGNTRMVSEWDGEVIVINFWATWCSPCLKEIPEFVALQNDLGDAGLQFIGIALEAEAGPVRDYTDRLKVNYPILIGEDVVMQLGRAYGNKIGALPYTAVIDRNGAVVFTKQGPLTYEEAEHVIRQYL